jgi:hypothetical protein
MTLIQLGESSGFYILFLNLMASALNPRFASILLLYSILGNVHLQFGGFLKPNGI